MTPLEIIATLSEIQCPPYTLQCVGLGHGTGGIEYGLSEGHAYLQVSCMLPDSVTGIPALQKGRKWRLSGHMTKTEFVQAAWAAVFAFAEHELREQFTYKGVAVFGPYIDIEARLEIAQHTDARKSTPAPSNVECFRFGKKCAHCGWDHHPQIQSPNCIHCGKPRSPIRPAPEMVPPGDRAAIAKPTSPGVCSQCGCTEENACTLSLAAGGATRSCSWANPSKTLCTNPDCMRKAMH